MPANLLDPPTPQAKIGIEKFQTADDLKVNTARYLFVTRNFFFKEGSIAIAMSPKSALENVDPTPNQILTFLLLGFYQLLYKKLILGSRLWVKICLGSSRLPDSGPRNCYIYNSKSDYRIVMEKK